MIFLISSILVSSLIFVIFRLFPKYGIDVLQAIVYNYFIACAFGFFMYGNQLKPLALEDLSWLPFCFVCGFLFIGLFLLIGASSNKNGVALTSVSIKMSMAISMLLMIIWYREGIMFLKIAGILLAIFGVLLLSTGGKISKTADKPITWMLILLFIGGGMLDFTLNYTQNHLVQLIPSSLFSAVGFFIAGMIGTVILIIGFITKKRVFHVRHVLAGIILGIPNFFSIFLLMQSYESMPWSDSTILAITNVSIVILSVFIGFVVFKEKNNLWKSIGLVCSVLAILVLYFASN